MRLKKAMNACGCTQLKKFMQKSPDLGFGRGGLSARGAA